MANVSYVPTVHYDRKIHRKITNTVGSELSNLGRPCYYPKISRYFSDTLSDLKLELDDLKRFKNTNIGKRYASFSIISDKQTLLLVVGIVYFARQKKTDISELFFLYLALKFHSNLMYRQFKFCQPDAFAMALERISHKHLYKVQNGIPPTIQYLAKAEYKKYAKVLGSNKLTDESIIRMVYALRTRLSQSIKSFAETYYKIVEEGRKQTTSDEHDDKLQRVADKIAMTMCTYGQVDKKAMSQAILKSGIRKELGITIASEISDPDSKDDVKFLLVLMHRLSDLKNVCIESRRLFMVRKVESGQKVGNYSPRDQIMKIIKSLPSSYSLRTVHDSQVIIFVSHYMTLFLQKRIC